MSREQAIQARVGEECADFVLYRRNGLLAIGRWVIIESVNQNSAPGGSNLVRLGAVLRYLACGECREGGVCRIQ